MIPSTPVALAPKQVESIALSMERNKDGHLPKVCIWDGSVRSGKTIGSLLAWLVAVATKPGPGEIVVVGRTRESIARNLFGPLQDVDLFGPKITKYISYTSGAPTAQVFGKTVHVIGASDARAEAVIRGMTIKIAYVDEATLVAEPFWAQLLARLSVKDAQLFATTNPDGPSHWLNKTAIKRAKELGYRRFHFVLEDNHHLMATNPEYVAQLKREYTGLWYDRFILGKWVQAEGAIYDVWDEKIHTIEPDSIPNIDKVLMVGLDYGTQHATRAYALGLGEHPDSDPDSETRYCLYLLDEFAPETKMTIGKQSREFIDWLDGVEEEWGRPSWVAVDPAAAHFRVQLFEDGLRNVMGAHNSVEPGIVTISALLATGQLLVSKRCKHLIDNIGGYMWDPKATARGESAPIKENDDEVDAMRYTIYTARRFWKSKVKVTPAQDDAPGAGSDDW